MVSSENLALAIYIYLLRKPKEAETMPAWLTYPCLVTPLFSGTICRASERKTAQLWISIIVVAAGLLNLPDYPYDAKGLESALGTSD